MPSPKLCFSLSSVCTILSVLHCAIAVLVNRTIDDENGDSETGIKPVYTPADGWAQGATCDACAVNSSLVDASQVFNRTWHSTTSGMDERTITISFSGIAVDVFFIVARSMPSTLAQTNMTITIDVAVDSQTPVVFPDVNDASYNFVHQFPSLVNGKPVYSARLFSQSGLPNEAHTLRIHTAGATNNLYAFDYLQYVAYDSSVATAPAPVSSGATSQDFSTGQATSLFLSPTSSVNDIPTAPPRTTSHGPNIGALAGGIIGGLALVLLLGVYVSRRRWLHGRPEGRNSAAGGDGKDGLAILFADSDSTSCSPSEDFIDELPGPGNVRSPSTIYAMFAQRSDPEGEHPSGSNLGHALADCFRQPCEARCCTGPY
ncbi:hypothetical protein BC628DRAFT_928449 [Trametes gibbosa]|nr:hypothetical protein BC628DRAFT_928449 [Trametes gibbosa]